MTRESDPNKGNFGHEIFLGALILFLAWAAGPGREVIAAWAVSLKH